MGGGGSAGRGVVASRRGSSTTLMTGVPPGGVGCCPRPGGARCVAGETTSPPERLWATMQSAQTQSYPWRGVGCASGCGTGGLQQLVWKSLPHTKQDSSVCGGDGTAPHAEYVRDATRAACWPRAVLAPSAHATVQGKSSGSVGSSAAAMGMAASPPSS